MKSKIQELELTGRNEIMTISKPNTLLKCSIFLFILSIGMCLLEEVDFTQIINSIANF